MPDTRLSVVLYALSTCVHCRRALLFLQDRHLPVDCIYVDKLAGQERSAAIAALRKLNPRLSFPTIVILPQERILVGFVEEEVQEALAYD